MCRREGHNGARLRRPKRIGPEIFATDAELFTTGWGPLPGDSGGSVSGKDVSEDAWDARLKHRALPGVALALRHDDRQIAGDERLPGRVF